MPFQIREEICRECKINLTQENWHERFQKKGTRHFICKDCYSKGNGHVFGKKGRPQKPKEKYTHYDSLNMLLDDHASFLI